MSLEDQSILLSNRDVNRRQLLGAATAAAAAAVCGVFEMTAPALATTAQSRPATREVDDIVWHDVREWGIEGKGFDDTEHYFDRLPARAKGIVRDPVWTLQRHSSGMSAHFEAETPAIHVRYTLTSSELAMKHMPATGVSGVDLYGRDGNIWRWIGTVRPDNQTMVAALGAGIAPGRRAYHVNLPLYNGVTSLEIGVPRGATFAPIAPRRSKPVLWYGTSVTQGGCVSRPGMNFPTILGRRMDTPILNFGFSGNGRMELEVGQFLAELNPAIFVLDCLANMTTEQVGERTIPLVKQLREAQPDTPILLLDERPYASSPMIPAQAKSHHEQREVLKRRYDELQAAGVKNIHFRAGDDLLGTDGEGTVDGSHPSDLGMLRYADALEPDLRRILNLP